MSMSTGGNPKGVYVVTDADLEGAVGGTFKVQPGPALRVAGFNTAGVRGVSGGPPVSVYVVDAAEAARRGVIGGKPIPIADLTSSGRGVDSPHIAIPIYIESGSEYIGDGDGPTPTPSLTYFNNAMIVLGGIGDFDNVPDWTLIDGNSSNISVRPAGVMYPQNLTGGDAMAAWTDPPVPIVGDDVWAQTEIYGPFSGNHNEFIGPAVRCSTTPGTNNCYALVIWQDGWDLLRYDNGSRNILADSAVDAPTEGDIFRLEAVGSTITAYKNDAQIAQVTDATYSSGAIGVVGEGLESTYAIYGLKCGALPIGNAFKMNNRFGNYYDGRHAVASCNSDVFVPDLADGFTTTGEQHLQNHVHYLEFDFLLPCTFWGVDTYQRLGDNANTTWTDFDVLGKMELADDYTVLETGLSMTNPGGSNFWKTSLFASGELGPYRYWRVNINSTADGDNDLAVWEVCFVGRVVT